MNKKVLVIVGLAFALAASGGVIALNSGSPSGQTKNPTAVTSTVTADNATEFIVDTSDAVPDETLPDLPDDSETEEPATEGDPVPTGYEGTVEPSVPYEEQIINASMTIQYVVDHTTGAQESPRVAFGEDYKYCYASFSDDNSFEMCVDPTAGVIRRGSYAIYGNIVSVEYDDGGGSEFEILTDEFGSVTHVIVSYGDYDIYFG